MGRQGLVVLSLVAILILCGMLSSTLATGPTFRVSTKRGITVPVSMANESVTTTPIGTSTPSVPLPDLVPRAESSGYPGWGWVSFYACVQNQGEAEAGPSVFLFGGSSWWPYKDHWVDVVAEKDSGALGVGGESCVHGSTILLSRVEVDIYDDVMESNEANNATIPPGPTDGGPYPTSTRTSTPPPTSTPSATPVSSGFFPLLANNWLGRPIWGTDYCTDQHTSSSVDGRSVVRKSQ